MKQVIVPATDEMEKIKWLARLTWKDLFEKAVLEYAKNHDLKE